MKKKSGSLCIICFAILIFAPTLFAQSTEELYSPLFLMSGVNTASVESPVADILNPAASGGQQRTTLDLNVIVLPDFAANMGFAGNFGISMPFNFGVISASAHYMSSPYTDSNLGWIGGLNVSFAKDVFNDLYLGAGLQLQTGAQEGEELTVGGGLDIGFLHFAGDLLFMKDFRWGIAIRGIGYGYTPPDDTRLFPTSITPAIGANFKLVKSNDFTFAVSPDVSIPLALFPFHEPFINFKANVGIEAALFDTVFFRSNVLNFDLQETLDSETNRWPLDALGITFGVTLKFKLPISRKIEVLDLSDQTDVKANLVATPIRDNVWGMGFGLNVPLGIQDKNPPKITIDTTKEVYISPNSDGSQDEMVLPIMIADERYISGYRFLITDASGNPVKTILNKDTREADLSFGNIVNRLGYVKQAIPVPGSLSWNGRSEMGAVVADGRYHFDLEAWDDNGNTSKSAKGTVIVDNTPPANTAKADYLIFSPNGDGNKDAIKIDQTGSSEDQWKGSFTDTTGAEVRTVQWDNGKPANFEWDGKNKDGILIPDGVYAYKLASTDRAGNAVTTRIDNIIINTQSTPININIGLANFSPNGDGIKDVLRFNLEIPVRPGIETWSLAIAETSGKPVKVFSGTKDVPDSIDFDGKSDANKTLSEGAYRGVLALLYQNGNNPNATSPEFTVDLTPPSASVNASVSVFSPNNDGNKDTIMFSQDTSEEHTWSGEIKDTAGRIVKTYTWRGKADSSVIWDGRNETGFLMPDGKFTYALAATDRAGNYGEAKKIQFDINTEETPVLITSDVSSFSPNSDGSVDAITFLPNLKVKSDVEKYSLVIKARDGSTVRTFTAENKAPDSIAWNGKDDKGKSVPDGEYKATLSILYRNGNNPSATTNQFFVDTVVPAIDITAPYSIFSPDGDGKKDILVIEQSSTDEDLWEAGILSKTGDVIRTYYWKGKAKRLEWDGKNEEGNKIPDGAYTYRVLSIDRAGNKIQKEIKSIEIDTSQTPVFLTIQSNGFSPNGDNFLDSIEFRLIVENEIGIRDWKLEIEHAEKGVQKTYNGASKIEKSIKWNGMTDKGLAPEGTYTATLTVEYAKGSTPVSKTPSFILDVAAPQLSLNMRPLPFSPDNDGMEDELDITPVIKDISEIAQWKIEIFDPIDKHFITFNGKGTPPAHFKWDGLSDRGILVESAADYPATFEATDAYGNAASIKSIIPIDILLVRVGNNYKIRIPSITFKPNTDDYTNVEAEKYSRNMTTLKRLAEVFKKYSTYNIVIEGHALSLLWADPKRAALEQEQDLLPLSKKRAEAIKKGLVALGIEGARIETTGLGGSQPYVPHGDQENNWKNRRVEFILVKNK